MSTAIAAKSPRPLPVVRSTPAETPAPSQAPGDEITNKAFAPPSARSLPVVGGVTEDDLRTSNTVAGFRYSRLKAIWYTFRIILGLPILPIWPYFVAKEAKDWSLTTTRYFPTLLYIAKTMVIHIRFGSFVRLLKYNLLLGPDEIKAQIAQRRGACTRCAKCCKQYDCLFLGKDEETKEHYCKVYQSDYWYYGTCGRYPIDQRDIDDHACPGFTFEHSPA